MSAKLPVSSEAQSARRRLVRGVFAAPVALTLQPASAQSVQSISPVARQVNNGPITNPTTVNSNAGATVGTYVGVRLYSMGGTPIDTASSWVSGSDLAALLPPGKTAHIAAGQFQAFSAESASTFTVGQIVTGAPATPGATPAFPVSPNGVYVGVQVDANGNIVGIFGIQAAPAGSSAIFNSSWNSFKA